MSELSAYSDCLDLPAAKKLFASLQKPGKKGTWTDWSGEGGSETEVEKEGFPASDISTFEVPAFCSSFRMLTSERLVPCTRRPRELLIGGDLFALPEYGDSMGVVVDVVLGGLNYPIRLGVGRNSGMRHYHRPFNECASFSLVFPKQAYQMEGLAYGGFPEKALARNVVEDLRKKFGLPNESYPGLLEKRDLVDGEMGEFSLKFELSRFGELKEIFGGVFVHLLAESPHHSYQFLSSVNFGSAAKFEGELHNVSPVIRELLPLVQAVNDYAAYDLTCYPLGPRVQ